jgi:hypothetical protein
MANVYVEARTRATRGWCPSFFAHAMASCCVLNVAKTWSA